MGGRMARVVPFYNKLFLSPFLDLQRGLLAVIPQREMKMMTQMITPLQAV